MKIENACKSCANRPNTPFACVGSGTLDFLSATTCVKVMEKNEMLLNEGDRADGFYCIKRGSIRNFKTSYAGKEQTFHISKGGDWIGFRDAISGENFNHSSLCLEETEVCFIEKSLISRMMKNDDKFQMEIMKYLASEWKDAENQVYSLGTKQVHNKLAELLLTFRKASENQDQIELKVTREVMASIIGVTTESLVRALSDFKARDWISSEKNTISFRNPAELIKLAEQESRA